MNNFELILAETIGKVGLISLNRPKQLNALNDQLMSELGAALDAFEADDNIGCIVITGSEKAFAAGADIGAMATFSYMDAYRGDYITRNWERVKTCRKPVIAAGASPKSSSASFPALAAPNACRAPSARPRPWICA